MVEENTRTLCYIKDLLNNATGTLSRKELEYSPGHTGQFHNFEVAASVTGLSNHACLAGFALKHIASVLDLVEGRLEPTTPMVMEKFGDLTNYIILSAAMEKMMSPEDIIAYIECAPWSLYISEVYTAPPLVGAEFAQHLYKLLSGGEVYRELSESIARLAVLATTLPELI